MTCPLATSPSGACQACDVCTFPARPETPAELAERRAYPAPGFVLEPDLRGKKLSEWMQKTDIKDGKAVRKDGKR